MLTGWQKVGGKWYLLKNSGAMAEGWAKASGTWYYLMPGSGAMKTGWLDLNGTWYYLDGSGAMVTGSRTINGKTNLFSKSGVWQGLDKIDELFTKWAQPESSATKWLILVDTKRCKVGVFYGSKGNWNLQRMMDCAPGKSPLLRRRAVHRREQGLLLRFRLCTLLLLHPIQRQLPVPFRAVLPNLLP